MFKYNLSDNAARKLVTSIGVALFVLLLAGEAGEWLGRMVALLYK